MVNIDSKELSDFVRSTIDGIEKGLKKGYELSGDIEFEAAVVNLKRGEGGIKLYVVDASGKYGKEAVSKIKFKITQSWEPSGGVNLWQS